MKTKLRDISPEAAVIADLLSKSLDLNIWLIPAGMSTLQAIHVVFRDGQKLSFYPSNVDVEQLYRSINTWNNIIDLRERDAITTS